MYNLYTGDPDDERSKIAHLLQLFSYARQHRLNFETQWEESASLVWPDFRNSFSFGHLRSEGVKYTQYQVDSTASASKAPRFMAICDALLTPHNMLWSEWRPSGPDASYLMKQREGQLYYDELTRVMWDLRYSPEANFQASQLTNWMCLGVFGNQGMFVEPYDARPLAGNGVRYMPMGPGEVYILQNHQGRVDGCILNFKKTAREAFQRWRDKIPPVLAAALEKADVFTKFDFLQFIIPRHDYDPRKIFSAQGKPWASIVVSITGYCVVEESGFYSFPMPHGRYWQAVEEWYGRGWVQQVLPDLKTKNAAKEAYLKQSLLAGDPNYLLPDDGLFDFKAEAGGITNGGWSADGKPNIGVLPTGNIQMTVEVMADLDKNIDAASLVDLFPMLFDKNSVQRSAREVIEVANQVAIFLAPTLGRQYSEYLYSMAMREYDVANRLRLLPPKPQVVRDANVRDLPKWRSPLARALNAQGIAGYMRSVELAAQVSQALGGDQSVFDPFDFDTAIPEMAEHQFAPIRWMASDKKIAAKRQARQAAAERDARAKEAPAQAAIMKAQAITAKAQTGGNIGGTLSGMAPGGMPQIPGNPPGQQGRPGVFGQPGQPGQPGLTE
ncbi:MAG: portal protein [Pseudonocardiaceae bacterium]